jgi:hypothetical protein
MILLFVPNGGHQIAYLSQASAVMIEGGITTPRGAVMPPVSGYFVVT